MRGASRGHRTPSRARLRHKSPSEHVSVLLTARAHLLAGPRVKAHARALEFRRLDELVARAAVLLPLLERELEGDPQLACEIVSGCESNQRGCMYAEVTMCAACPFSSRRQQPS